MLSQKNPIHRLSNIYLKRAKRRIGQLFCSNAIYDLSWVLHYCESEVQVTCSQQASMGKQCFPYSSDQFFQYILIVINKSEVLYTGLLSEVSTVSG